jgi:hypothetical protein
MTAVSTNRPHPLQVGTTNAAAQELRDIKPPVAIPGSWPWLALALLAVLALAALAAWFWRRRQRPPAPALIIPPHVHARNRLRDALAFIHEPNPFCTRVSNALRTYLEDRFKLHAPDRTTDEFLEELGRAPFLSTSQREALADFLARCDLVKFARDEPNETELRGLWDTAMRFVDQTAYETQPQSPETPTAVPASAPAAASGSIPTPPPLDRAETPGPPIP